MRAVHYYNRIIFKTTSRQIKINFYNIFYSIYILLHTQVDIELLLAEYFPVGRIFYKTYTHTLSQKNVRYNLYTVHT